MCTKSRFILCVMDVYMAWSDRIDASSRKCSAASTPPTSYASAASHRRSEPAAMGHSSVLGWPDDVPFGTGAGCWSAAASMPASPPPCLHIGSSADASPYDSAEEGPTRSEPARSPGPLNAGEALDVSLHEHWAGSVPALRVDARELEQFGRSTSF